MSSQESAAKTVAPSVHWENVRQQVNKRLQTYCDEQLQKAVVRNPVEQRLWHMLTEVVMGGGKRLRPYLVVWAHQAFGGKLSSSIIDAGTAWEMLHQALLIHDDIIDRDYIRHGQPNVAGKLQAHYADKLEKVADRNHYADSGALLAGDLALTAAYQLLLGSGFSSKQTMHACQVLTENISIVAGGELLDTEAVMEPLGTTDCLLVAERKTAGYSFVGPLQTGAILAGASNNTLNQLAELGKSLGIAFQLRDDVLGLFGNEEITGKPTDSDVHEGKRTLLLQYAFEAAAPRDKAIIERVIGDPTASAADVQSFRNIVATTGAHDKVERLVSDYLDRADSIITTLSLDAAASAQYQFLVNKLRQRKV